MTSARVEKRAEISIWHNIIIMNDYLNKLEGINDQLNEIMGRFGVEEILVERRVEILFQAKQERQRCDPPAGSMNCSNA